ncbi:MAG TPA: peptide chain release factor N(5)-glutamine methyltransferase [Balneolaceae bacterium]|nr:peptide chain release factor N(5)-glutamine methyltransferase [Balneolaceae bacterium]
MKTDQDVWTVLSMLEWATDYFKQKNITDPRHSIEWLLADVLGIKRLDLYLAYDRPLSPDELDQLRPLVKRRAKHEPLQYITGYDDFLNTRVDLTPDVLIPRIETEQLVEIILDDHTDARGLSVLDVGTGSGCIPIALKKERPSWQISAMDISEDALEVAQKNAAQNEVEVTFVQGDLTQPGVWPLSGPFDLIVSNPPYILPEEKTMLAAQVKEYEPSQALFCNSIAEIYQPIIRGGLKYLQEEGDVYLEINESYPGEILSLFESQKWSCTLLKDYARKPRFITAHLHS